MRFKRFTPQTRIAMMLVFGLIASGSFLLVLGLVRLAKQGILQSETLEGLVVLFAILIWVMFVVWLFRQVSSLLMRKKGKD